MIKYLVFAIMVVAVLSLVFGAVQISANKNSEEQKPIDDNSVNKNFEQCGCKVPCGCGCQGNIETCSCK